MFVEAQEMILVDFGGLGVSSLDDCGVAEHSALGDLGTHEMLAEVIVGA